MSLLNIR